MANDPIPQAVYALYDAYCHSEMSRRAFLARASAVAGSASVGLALLPDYARACTISFNDERITGRYLRFASPGGNGDDLRAYVVAPRGDGPFPAVLVVHENRGLNPYIEDVARRLAVEGFVALAPDALTAAGGYPGNDDEGKALQASLDRDKILADMANAARHLRGHELSNGKLGVVGFCFGGMVCNHLAAELGDDLQAAAPFYGRPPDLARVHGIKARMLLHYAEDDQRVNATRADYEAALRKHGVAFASHTYEGTRHGFHNDSTPRFHREAADVAWNRTLALFRTALAR